MAQTETIAVTVTGRIVGGSATAESLMKGGHRRKYQQGVPPDKRELELDNSGKPINEWYLRLAVSKTGLDALGNNNNGQALFDAILKQASIFKPNGFTPDPTGASLSYPKDYSLKYKDGDLGKNEEGKPYSEYDFNKNCMLFEIGNTYAPKWLKRAEDGLLEHCQEGEIKVGDHVAVSLLIGAGKSSVYLNLVSTLLLKSGERIGGDAGPRPEDAFAAFTKPSVGVSASVGNFGQPAPTQNQQQTQQQAAPVQNQFGQPVQNQQQAAPHHGVLPTTHQPANQFGQQVQGGGQQQTQQQAAPASNPFQFPNHGQGQS